MLVQKYKDMLAGKSVIRELSEFATARGQEIGYENVFDYSLGNPSLRSGSAGPTGRSISSWPPARPGRWPTPSAW